MIFDIDVLIWALRGSDRAADHIERDGTRAVSVLSFMELMRGARSKAEAGSIRQLILQFQSIPLSEEIGYRASIYMEQYALRVALTPIDALIAASAVEHQLTLCTGNAKHFRSIPDLDLKVFRPH